MGMNLITVSSILRVDHEVTKFITNVKNKETHISFIQEVQRADTKQGCHQSANKIINTLIKNLS